MKTIGIIGGLSWQSTAQYYQHINQAVNTKLGGLHSAKIHLHSVDFSGVEKLLKQGDWPALSQKLTTTAQAIEASKADFIMIANNTLHKVADEVANTINIPLLHIVDVMGEQLLKDNISRVGLLGTISTMELGFYKNRLHQKYSIDVIIPELEKRAVVQDIIFNELCLGQLTENAKNRLLTIIDGLKRSGAEAVILGCTELPLIVPKNASGLPLYDSGQLHCEAAVELALTKLNNLYE